MVGQRLVVIGGDAAGGSAASQAKKREPDLDVVMFERGRATSYSACGIPYWIGGAIETEDQLIARTPEQHRRNGIDLRMRTEVVGGGYIGLEIAEAAKQQGLDVTVVDLSPTPVGTFDPDIGEFIADAVRGQGIETVFGDGVAGIDVGPDGRARAVTTASGLELPTDLVVLGLGVRPNVG